ncbi:hypothetical protein, partial [Streptomyces capuensis]|uniref:hypothetical protein n=1 Tax=Streptomyces capuensis TaxID=1464056 RepID=UPI000518FD79
SDRTTTVRSATADRTAVPDRRTTAVSTDRTDERTGPDIVLTDLESAAIDLLRSTQRSISKRSICHAVRNELNGSIASDRASDIARHFRALHAA